MFDALHGSRVFLTGGTGFFGKWLLSLFQKLGTEVVVLSRSPDHFVQQFPMFGKNRNFTFVRGDVRDFCPPSGRFDYVVHAATEASEKLERENPEEMFSVITEGTARVLEFSEQAGVKRILYISSGAVYGRQPPELSHIPETFPCNPVTVYGRGKLQAERMCLESGIDAVIARPFAFVGPWLPLNAHFAIGNFIRNCLRNESIEIKGDGTPLRSYMYGSDLAEWLLILLIKGRFGEAYNVGSEDVVSISELAQLVCSVCGTDNDVVVGASENPDVKAASYVPATQKAIGELELTLRVGLEEAIRKTYLWYKNQEKGFVS